MKKNKKTTEETYELERPREIKIYKSPVYKVLGTKRPEKKIYVVKRGE